MQDSREPLRAFLLREVKRFVESTSQISGVVRIALIGSLVTNKPDPKDADVLVTIDENVDIDSLAEAGRRLKGKGQSQGSGADIFLASPEGDYLGRICSFRECHPRVRCSGNQCHLGSRICDDLDIVRLDRKLVEAPPLELWPQLTCRKAIPDDVRKVLLN
jgi:predicted nucleotidyltransferase